MTDSAVSLFLCANEASRFSEYICQQVGSRNWVIAPRLTDRLRRAGYEVAISSAQHRHLKERWERETLGAPIERLIENSPDMLAALKRLLTWSEGRVWKEDPEWVAVANLVARIEEI